MLAYAAQGVVEEAGSQSAAQLRGLLARAEEALIGLADAVTRRSSSATTSNQPIATSPFSPSWSGMRATRWPPCSS